MSLWLDSVLTSLQNGEYKWLREMNLPNAPVPMPECMYRELEFAERRCTDLENDRLFPIRFLWLMEAHEQRMFGLKALERSRYHPEKLLELWDRVSADTQYEQELETAGFRFDFDEKAVQLEMGWVYIGDSFIQDFIDVLDTLGVELLFPDGKDGEGRPAFHEYKRHSTDEESRED
jgi:hypothetical protein